MSVPPPKPWERAGASLLNGAGYGAAVTARTPAATGIGSAHSAGHSAANASHSPLGAAASSAGGHVGASSALHGPAAIGAAAPGGHSAYTPPSTYGGGYGGGFGGYGGYGSGYGGAYGSGYGGTYGGYGGGAYGGYGGGYGRPNFLGGLSPAGGFLGQPPPGEISGLLPDSLGGGLRSIEQAMFTFGRLTQLLEMNFETLHHFLGALGAFAERVRAVSGEFSSLGVSVRRQSIEFGEASVARLHQLRGRPRRLAAVLLLVLALVLRAVLRARGSRGAPRGRTTRRLRLESAWEAPRSHS